jgi:hypothetical protein
VEASEGLDADVELPWAARGEGGCQEGETDFTPFL